MKKYLIILMIVLFVATCSKKEQKETEVGSIEEKPTIDTVEMIVETPSQDSLEHEYVGEKIVEKTDSVEYLYMVRPDDWLTKIALNEYGDVLMWKAIYKWNRDLIGSDPDMIFPFYEYTLKKPPSKANPVKYSLYQYIVKSNETLWDIALEEYGNAYAWVVIFKDNKDKVSPNTFTVFKGTILNLRSKLF